MNATGPNYERRYANWCGILSALVAVLLSAGIRNNIIRNHLEQYRAAEPAAMVVPMFVGFMAAYPWFDFHQREALAKGKWAGFVRPGLVPHVLAMGGLYALIFVVMYVFGY